MDQYVTLMRGNKQMQLEFQAAYKDMVRVLEDGKMRFKGNERDKVRVRCEEVRKAAVNAYQKSEVVVRNKFRAVEVGKYEEQFPGRIKAKNMKVLPIKCSGVMKDCVLLPKLPEGEHEVEIAEVFGVEIQEQHDNREHIISEGQLQRKYHALSSGSSAQIATSSSANQKLEEEAEFSDAESKRVKSDDESLPDAEIRDESEGDLKFVRKSLLDSTVADLGLSTPIKNRVVWVTRRRSLQKCIFGLILVRGALAW